MTGARTTSVHARVRSRAPHRRESARTTASRTCARRHRRAQHNGRLIARYYLRYGPIDALDGSEQLVTLYGTTRVRKRILLGTPNFGSVASLHACPSAEPIGHAPVPAPEVLATMPSGGQPFPHPLGDVADRHRRQRPNCRRTSCPDPATWRWHIARRCSIPRPRRAVRARARRRRRIRTRNRCTAIPLNSAWSARAASMRHDCRRRGPGVRRSGTSLFGGDCALTPRAAAARERDGALSRSRGRIRTPSVRASREVRFTTRLMLGPGDGRRDQAVTLLARRNARPLRACSSTKVFFRSRTGSFFASGFTIR